MKTDCNVSSALLKDIFGVGLSSYKIEEPGIYTKPHLEIGEAVIIGWATENQLNELRINSLRIIGICHGDDSGSKFVLRIIKIIPAQHYLNNTWI